MSSTRSAPRCSLTDISTSRPGCRSRSPKKPPPPKRHRPSVPNGRTRNGSSSCTGPGRGWLVQMASPAAPPMPTAITLMPTVAMLTVLDHDSQHPAQPTQPHSARIEASSVINKGAATGNKTGGTLVTSAMRPRAQRATAKQKPKQDPPVRGQRKPLFSREQRSYPARPDPRTLTRAEPVREPAARSSPVESRSKRTSAVMA